MQPLVSILIPCHNAERWIAQAIESGLAQTWVAKEIIVVDDGSTDRSLSIIRQYDGRIQWESGPNRGGNAARNRLLELARGDWLQYLDADDYLLPDKIREQMVFIAKLKQIDVLFGPNILEHCSEKAVRLERVPIPTSQDLWVLLASWQLPQTGAPLWRKEAVFSVGGWKEDQPCCQDYELYLRMLIAGRHFKFHATSGAVYRLWSHDTVCRRNISEVHLCRLEIEKLLEEHLRTTKQLTPERLKAINISRFEIARGVWHYDPVLAQDIIHQVHKADPSFSPRGPAAPNHYRLVFNSLGFQLAERLAGLARRRIWGGGKVSN